MWPGGLPVAVTLLWQIAQLLGSMPTWLKRVFEKLTVLWQVSQVAAEGVGMWDWGLTTFWVASGRPAVWQLEHCVGVPLKTPLMWQVSQRWARCTPVRAKPVRA